MAVLQCVRHQNDEQNTLRPAREGRRVRMLQYALESHRLAAKEAALPRAMGAGAADKVRKTGARSP